MSAQALAVIPQSKDLGDGVIIDRFLPQPSHRPIGPFVFFDYLPRIQFSAGTGSDVRPHPHIGLSTLSYLFEGRMHHRDSLGYDLILSPGDVLLMTSGRGIVHSERTPQADRRQAHSIHMVQFWLALPQSHETMEPRVAHASRPELPVWEVQPGLQARLAIGTALGQEAPVSSLLNPFLVDFEATEAGRFRLRTDQRESALFLLSGPLQVNGSAFEEPALLTLAAESDYEISYPQNSHWLWLGGALLDGHRIVWWNLVASKPELITAAKEKWRQGQFQMVAGDPEFIPLPPEA